MHQLAYEISWRLCANCCSLRLQAKFWMMENQKHNSFATQYCCIFVENSLYRISGIIEWLSRPFLLFLSSSIQRRTKKSWIPNEIIIKRLTKEARRKKIRKILTKNFSVWKRKEEMTAKKFLFCSCRHYFTFSYIFYSLNRYVYRHGSL